MEFNRIHGMTPTGRPMAKILSRSNFVSGKFNGGLTMQEAINKAASFSAYFYYPLHLSDGGNEPSDNLRNATINYIGCVLCVKKVSGFNGIGRSGTWGICGSERTYVIHSFLLGFYIL